MKNETSRQRFMVSDLFRIAGLAAMALAVVGCLGDLNRPEKAPGSAIWVDAASTLDADALAQLEAVGMTGIFVHAADIDSSGALSRRPLPDLPAGREVTLALGGSLDPGETPEERGVELAAGLRQLRYDVEAQGLVPVGIHFDLSAMGDDRQAGELFGALRSELGDDFFVSISLDRRWIGNPELPRLIRKVDFVVPFLYGQRAEEADASDAWDLLTLEKRLEQVEELGKPYLLGVRTLGTATLVSPNGDVRARSTEQAAYPFIRDRSLELKPGFSLQGANRRYYTFTVKTATSIGGWELQPGEEVHLALPGTTDLRDLLEVLSPEEHPNHLGHLFYRWPHSGEHLTLSIKNILNAHAEEPVHPELTVDVEVQRRTARGWLLRVFLENLSGETTELSFLDRNFLQLQADPGAFPNDIDTGDFYRYEFLRQKDDGSLERTIRSPDVLRLFLPIIEGQEKLATGAFEVRRRSPELLITGEFMLPDGTTLKVGPYGFKNGELEDLRPKPEGAEEGTAGESAENAEAGDEAADG